MGQGPGVPSSKGHVPDRSPPPSPCPVPQLPDPSRARTPTSRRPSTDTCHCFRARELCDATETRLPCHTPPELRRQCLSTPAPPALEEGRSLGTVGHPLTAPLRSSPRLHQAGRRPTRHQVYGVDRVTRQAAWVSRVGGLARVERAQGRGDPSPVRPQGNRVRPTAVQPGPGRPGKAQEEEEAR